jgi:GT2 family glycosyltransferase
MRNKQKGVFVEMPFCIGFCMVIRREVINKIGGLSEEFHPIFFEDSDYSMKVLKAGYFIGVAKGAYVWHNEHASFKQMGRNKEGFFRKNRRIFENKWGKILRIAWIVDSDKELIGGLDKAIALTRDGNFVSLFAKNTTNFKSIILEKNNYIEPSIKLIEYRNLFELAWKILKKKKKKKYEPIITENKFVQQFFRSFAYKVLSGLDENKIAKIKKPLKEFL